MAQAPGDAMELESRGLLMAYAAPSTAVEGRRRGLWRALAAAVAGCAIGAGAMLALGPKAAPAAAEPGAAAAAPVAVEGEALQELQVKAQMAALGPFVPPSFPAAKALCHKCKHPHEPLVPHDSGPQCQHGVWKNRPDKTIMAVNIIISPFQLGILDHDPKAHVYVPCDAIINYGQFDQMYFKGAQCMYKGSTGSFMGCLDGDGHQAMGHKACRMMSRKLKLSHATTVINGKEMTGPEALNVSGMNLHGMQHDDSLLKNHLAYRVMRDLGIVAPCSEPANLYINGAYQGVVDVTEAVDRMYTLNRFPYDSLKGAGTLWSETWPVSCFPLYYKTIKPIPGLAWREISEMGADGGHYDLFANLYREAKACMKSGLLCTPLRANMILNKYTHPDSFLNGLVGMAVTSNSDQIHILKHNFFFYVMDGKFYYLVWDFDQVFVDVTASPIPGYAVPFPWYQRLTPEQRKEVCPYQVPSNSSDLTQKRFEHLNCDPVGYVMGVAWKRRYQERIRHLSQLSIVAQAKVETINYNLRIAPAVKCGAENNGWPDSIKTQQDATCPLVKVLDKTISFWKAVVDCTLDKWPTPTFADFPEQVTKCMFDGMQAAQYLGQAGIQIALAVQDCPHTPNGISACTADISNVVASFGYVATFASSVLSTCPLRDASGFATRGMGTLYDSAPQVMCAEEVSRIIAGLASVSASAAGMSEMCIPGKAMANRAGIRGRRLVSTGFVKSREMERATCSFDVMGAVFWIGIAALAIDEAEKTCSDFFGNPAICSRSVFAILEALGYVSMFLADSIAQCAEEANFPLDKAFEASCAADISQFIAGLSSVAEGGSGASLVCGIHGKKPFTRTKPHWRFLAPESYMREVGDSRLAMEGLARGETHVLRAWIDRQRNLSSSVIGTNLG